MMFKETSETKSETGNITTVEVKLNEGTSLVTLGGVPTK